MTIIPCGFGPYLGRSFKFFARSWQTSKNFEQNAITPIHECCLPGHVPSRVAHARFPRVAAIWPLVADASCRSLGPKVVIQIEDCDLNDHHTMLIGPHSRVVIQIPTMVIQIQICNLNDHHTMLIRSIFGGVIQIFGQILANL